MGGGIHSPKIEWIETIAPGIFMPWMCLWIARRQKSISAMVLCGRQISDDASGNWHGGWVLTQHVMNFYMVHTTKQCHSSGHHLNSQCHDFIFLCYKESGMLHTGYIWMPDDDFWNKWLHVYDQVTTTRVVSYDHVTTTGVVSYDHVTTTGVVSYDHVTSIRVVSYNLVMTVCRPLKK